MGSIWKPTIQYEPYRGDTFRQNAHWSPTHTQELYHYGRKGMKWYKHIFGNFNLKAMGTGVGNLLDEDKVKEIARKLGIPLNQINQKMGVIREYFMRERRSQMTGNNPPAYDKTKRDAEELRKTVEAVNRYTRSLKEREKEVAEQLDLPEKTYDEVVAERKAKEEREFEAYKRNHADERHDEYLAEQRAKRKQKQAQKERNEFIKKVQQEKREQEEYEKAERKRSYDELSERVERNKQQKAAEEKAKREKEERQQKWMDEQLAEQRRDEEEAYRQYLKRIKKDSGGGHRF